ncbi:MAG TPA: glycosyltransferase family 1 protein [Alloacidobacterium sp.]|nr:glycosyltransferase family 1 protein [Alloacidobacterium sp.]
MKRIAVNLLSFDTPDLTGVGYFFKRLFEALPPLVDTEFFFFCQRRFEFERVIQIPEMIRVTRVNVPNFPNRAARILYEQLVLPFRCRQMNILYSPCTANPLFRFNPVVMITTIHDLTPFYVPNKYGLLQSTYVRYITRLLARFSDQIITVSENSKRDLIRITGVQSSRIQIIYNFIKTRNVSHIRYDPFFLAVGTRQPAKNLLGVIRSFSKFCERYDTENHRLIIVGGSGWGNDEYTNLVAALGMERRIEFRGYVSEQVLHELYATCKGHILLSLYEGFGIPVLEALSYHKPSVASNISSLPEVMGLTGIGVDPHNYEDAAWAIKTIADDPRKHLTGLNDQLKKFSAEKQVAAFLTVLGVNEAITR